MNEIDEIKILQNALYFIPIDVINIIDKFLVYVDVKEFGKKLVLMKDNYYQSVKNAYVNLVEEFVKKLEPPRYATKRDSIPHTLIKRDTINYVKNIFQLFYNDEIDFKYHNTINYGNEKIDNYYIQTGHKITCNLFDVPQCGTFTDIFCNSVNLLIKYIDNLKLPYFKCLSYSGSNCILMMFH